MNRIGWALATGVLAMGLVVFPAFGQAADETATVATDTGCEPVAEPAEPAEDAVARTDSDEAEAPVGEEYLYPFGEGCPFAETDEVPGTV